MPGTEIKLPGVGTLPRKQVYVAVGAVVVIGGVMYYRKKQAANAATTATTGTAATDPQTGYPMGSPEDLAALAALSASSGTGGSYGGGSGVITTPTPVPGTGLTTNAQWSQTVIDYFTNTLSLDAGPISSALGKYIGGQGLTPTEAELIHQAIALEGPPPVAGGDGYPPNLRLTTATTPTPGGTKKLVPGQELRIPYDVAPGQASRVASKFGISLAHLLTENPGKTGHETAATEYIIPIQVKQGMTLNSVANSFGISVEHLLQYVPAT